MGRGEAGKKLQEEDLKNAGEIQPNDLWEAWLLAKEGDGAGNSGVTSTETTGVYNARYSDSKGRYRDQEKDKKERKEDEDEKEERRE